ncbi:MAG TPA: hypothetical protein VMB50_02920 [Myxococcales bacterium]|nr:hypothetical protein [Myxococcales bacterium]
MRRTLLCSLLASLSAGCAFQITEPMPTTTLTVSSQDEGQPLPPLESLAIPPQNVGPAGSAGLDSVTFTSTATPAQTFDFLDSVTVSVSAPGLPTVQVATLSPVPPGATSVSLDVVSGVNLLPYVQAGCTVTATGTGSYPSQDFSFDGQVVIDVGL